ncbi:peroxidase family protein [Moorena sp. SIO4G3]|uniref:peroxidase family protein n=1 Tax=Moorena sp. SIO4G3 TaxID=2607821 RepID=UPI00142CB11F|nr:peroxidase family protein [Moorena sp. SIO4G3]NEO78459.1 heme peroxidase [Moorena sp. SIO4G3]
MAKKRNTSRDGFRNQLENFGLNNFNWIWDFIQSNDSLRRKVNKTIINNAVYKMPTRPHKLSAMAPYTSWDSLTDRTWIGRHLPPDPEFNKPGNLPPLEDLAVLFRKKEGKTIYSEKSTLLFPYWVQWFTDGFLRTDRYNRLKNTSNHGIDLSPVYGLNRKSTDMLRSNQGGKLKSQIINGEEYPLFYYDDPEQGVVKPEFDGLYEPLNDEKRLDPAKKAKLFAMGVERANVQIGYVMHNVLCLREHNRLCDLLAKHYPDWDDERLFQTARNIVMVLIMKIVVEEYVNHITSYHFNFIVDPPAFTNERWYRQNWMTVEFSLVYRWHSALPETLTYDSKQIPMVDSLWNNEMLINKGLGPLFEETCSQAGSKIGLFNTSEFLIPVELASLDLGRQAQLASYNDYREMCQFPRVTDFDQITGDEDTQRELKRLYGDVNKIEFYVGLYAEDVPPNAAVAALVTRMIAVDAFSQALTNPLLAENIFNEETFSPVGWEVIQNTNTLSDVVNRNTQQQDKSYKVTFDNP